MLDAGGASGGPLLFERQQMARYGIDEPAIVLSLCMHLLYPNSAKSSYGST